MRSSCGNMSGRFSIARGLPDRTRQIIYEQGQGFLRLRTEVPGIPEQSGNTVQLRLKVA